MYGVTAVHVDPRGRVERVRMQPVDLRGHRLIGESEECPAHKAAGLVSVHETLVSIFFVEGGGWVPGPTFKLAVYAHGVEGIELSEDVDGFRLQDMAQF